MSYHTPAGWADRCTFRDPTLDHQIIISTQPIGSWKLVVRCNCLPGTETLAVVTTAEEALAVYADHVVSLRFGRRLEEIVLIVDEASQMVDDLLGT